MPSSWQETLRCSDRHVYIYALCEPATREIRYIGKTVNPRERFQAHLRVVNRSADTHVARWIRCTVRAGSKPHMLILDTVTGATANQAERGYIAEYRQLGCRLVNTTAGGDGCIGRVWTPEMRAKSSATQKGRPKFTPEQRAAISARLQGRKLTPESRAKIAAAGTGRKHTAESRAKMSARKFTDEHRAHLSDANRRNSARLSTSLKRYWEQRRTEAAINE